MEKASFVEFDEGTAWTRTTLKRRGDTFYGVGIDPGTKRVSVSVELHRMGHRVDGPSSLQKEDGGEASPGTMAIPGEAKAGLDHAARMTRPAPDTASGSGKRPSRMIG